MTMDELAYAEPDRPAGKWRVMDGGEPVRNADGAVRHWPRFTDAYDHAEDINRARKDAGSTAHVAHRNHVQRHGTPGPDAA